MPLDSEEEVKKALGIKSFREMSKEKTLALYAALPDMANEVRLKLIEQIPTVQKFALDAVNVIEQTFEKTLESTDKSQEKLHDSFSEVRSVLKGELARDDISEEYRRYLIEQLGDDLKEQASKDTENKEFVAAQADDTRKSVIIITGIAILAGVVLAGGKVMLSRDDEIA